VGGLRNVAELWGPEKGHWVKGRIIDERIIREWDE